MAVVIEKLSSKALKSTGCWTIVIEKLSPKTLKLTAAVVLKLQRDQAGNCLEWPSLIEKVLRGVEETKALKEQGRFALPYGLGCGELARMAVVHLKRCPRTKALKARRALKGQGC